MKLNKVCTNLTQDFTDEQKGIARTSVHLTVWFKADLANSLYRFYLVEEART